MNRPVTPLNARALIAYGLFALPLSLLGVAVALIAWRSTLNIFSMIGFIMLMGLVTKNAILLVDFAVEAMATGTPRDVAIVDAGRKRARPIVMTTVAMVAGMLPMALGLGTALVTGLYLLLNVVFLYAAPLEELKGKFAVGAFAASKLFGPQVASVFSGLMALSLMSTVNAMVTVGPRVYYAMAKNGAFLKMAAEVHPRWRTPVAAIVAQGICTMLMTLTPFPQLVVYIGFVLNFFTAMGVASLFVFRGRQGWRKLPVVSFAWPAIPVLFVLVDIVITIVGIQLKPWISLAAVITVLAGAVVYRLAWRPEPIKAVD